MDGESIGAPAHHWSVDNRRPPISAAGGVNALSRPLPLGCFGDGVNVVWDWREPQETDRAGAQREIERGQAVSRGASTHRLSTKRPTESRHKPRRETRNESANTRAIGGSTEREALHARQAATLAADFAPRAGKGNAAHVVRMPRSFDAD